MHLVRRLLAQRRLASLICAAALLLKLAVPPGWMIDASQHRIMITVCPGTAAGDVQMAMPAAHGDMSDHVGPKHRGKAMDHGRAEVPCSFSGLSAAVLGPIDPVQLVGLIAFVMAGGLVAVRLPPSIRRTHLRPPPRGPPAYL